MTNRRVVVTGLGLVSPVGLTVDAAWDNVINGRSGISEIDSFDVSEYPTRIGGLIRGLDLEPYLTPKEARKCDPFIHYGIVAAIDALKDSGLEIDESNAERAGVHIGSGIGGIGTIESSSQTLQSTGKVRKISPFFVPSSIINMISGNVSILTGMKGPNLATVTACTTAAHCIGVSARLIAYGDADMMLAGGAEAGATPLGLAGFCAARAVSQRNDEPARASRPWDADRDGFVLSDGAGVLMLEEYEHARRRGARIYAELSGFGMSGDAYHITAPPESGEGARRCMQAALNDAGLNPEQIGYINAHGTSTLVGDVAETDAVKAVFGEAARRVPMSSTKSMTGHLLGAAGGLEAVFSILALRDGIIPPTINLENPGPGCDLDYVPGSARQATLKAVLSNSFGFGGTNGTLIFQTL